MNIQEFLHNEWSYFLSSEKSDVDKNGEVSFEEFKFSLLGNLMMEL